jgi:mevalonate kinase
VKACAPGKVILFGEHGVVYGRPAMAVPVSQVHAEVDVAPASRPGIWIEAPDVGLHAELSTLPSDHPIAATVRNLLADLAIDPFPDLTIGITSTIPVASGMGSGAAVSVALIRALSSFLSRPLSDEQVSAHAYEIEKLHHGTPSGIDNAVVTYAKPVYFVKGQPIEILGVGKPFTLVIGDTGVPAPTKEAVGDVRQLWETDRRRWEGVFDEIGRLAIQARAKIVNGQWQSLGPLMDLNHTLLQTLTVSSPQLDRLVQAARGAGALGAKLSGGGRGGNMIALAAEGAAENLGRAVVRAGARRVIIAAIGSSA